MFRFLTAGESHGQCLTAIVEGIPAGLPIDVESMNLDMARRQKGYGRGGRMKIETDKVEILSGVRFGETMGDPITLKVANKDWGNWTERMSVSGEPFGAAVTAARPGHADLIGTQKYDRKDIRDILERASARETAARVAVGGLAKQLLKACGIEILSHVVNIGSITVDDKNIDPLAKRQAASELNCADPAAEEKMKETIEKAKAAGDTLGGVFEVIVTGAPVGLGSHIQWDRRLDARLTSALMSIQAIKGVEIGAGFAFWGLRTPNIIDSIPLFISPHMTARAAPPAPKRTAFFPLTTNPFFSKPVTKPTESVLCPVSFPSSTTTVLTAPIILAFSSIASKNLMILTLCGIVTLKPQKPNACKPLTAVSSSTSFTGIAI
jgi:chorismate synthase